MPVGVVQRGGTEMLSPVAFLNFGAVQFTYFPNPKGTYGRPFMPGACISFNLVGGNAVAPALAPGQCGHIPPPYSSGGDVQITWQAARRADAGHSAGTLGLQELGKLHSEAASSGAKVSVLLMKKLGF